MKGVEARQLCCPRCPRSQWDCGARLLPFHEPPRRNRPKTASSTATRGGMSNQTESQITMLSATPMYSAFGQDGHFSERGNGGRYHDFLQPPDGADAMKLLNSVWLQC